MLQSDVRVRSRQNIYLEGRLLDCFEATPKLTHWQHRMHRCVNHGKTRVSLLNDRANSCLKMRIPYYRVIISCCLLDRPVAIAPLAFPVYLQEAMREVLLGGPADEAFVQRRPQSWQNTMLKCGTRGQLL